MTATPPQPGRSRFRGFEAVRRTLDKRGVDYEVVTHEHTGTTLEHAVAAAIPVRRAVETVAVWASGQISVVALPASERLDVGLVQQLLGDPSARLATESELSQAFPDFGTGALPPFGAPAPPLVLVDRRVLCCNWVLANGGDHRHSFRVSPLEIVRISHARVADIGAS